MDYDENESDPVRSDAHIRQWLPALNGHNLVC